MVDLSPLRSFRVDPDRRRAWVAGGAVLGDLDRASQPHGLATTSGNVSDAGVGGLTLGGGMGWLARRFGLACDNVTRFQMVTADGAIVEASEAENAERTATAPTAPGDKKPRRRSENIDPDM